MMDTDKQKNNATDYINLNKLKETYFSNPKQRIDLKKGDCITHQGKVNDKMFLVESGSVSGYYKPLDSDEFVVFTTGPNMMVGIYSFFSSDHNSYTTVKASEDTRIYYMTLGQIPSKHTHEYHTFLHHILPLIVNEIYLRQMLTVRSISDKEAAIQKLLDNERMATLGQLAAGLAHELNNAIGVIQSKTQWITHNLKYYISEKDSKGLYPYFLKALENGQTLSSTEIRSKKKEIINRTKIKGNIAKKLAKMDLSFDEIRSILANKNEDIIERLNYYWDAGLALHDIGVASNHTTHVVQSIKELGAVNRNVSDAFSLKMSVQKSISLLSSMINNIEVQVDIDEVILMNGKEGDFIQVWLNIIKNAVENFIAHDTVNANVKISATNQRDKTIVKIEDNGSGIPKEVMSKIFQPNFTSKVDGLSFGLGLGLSIVQKIIISYNGKLGVFSDSEGTTFTIEIPNQ